MSNEYDNRNTGSLFRNEKGDNPKRPDYKGSLDVDGVQYWVSGWIRKIQKGDKAGQQFMSLKIEKKEQQPFANSTPATPTDGEDVLPF